MKIINPSLQKLPCPEMWLDSSSCLVPSRYLTGHKTSGFPICGSFVNMMMHSLKGVVTLKSQLCGGGGGNEKKSPVEIRMSTCWVHDKQVNGSRFKQKGLKSTFSRFEARCRRCRKVILDLLVVYNFMPGTNSSVPQGTVTLQMIKSAGGGAQQGEDRSYTWFYTPNTMEDTKKDRIKGKT